MLKKIDKFKYNKKEKLLKFLPTKSETIAGYVRLS